MAPSVPDDLLCPIWRCVPAHGSGVFTIGLDPREAAFVLKRGWATLDGVRYTVSTDGCDPNIQGDGRIMVRCQIDDTDAWNAMILEANSFRRMDYSGVPAPIAPLDAVPE